MRSASEKKETRCFSLVANCHDKDGIYQELYVSHFFNGLNLIQLHRQAYAVYNVEVQ